MRWPKGGGTIPAGAKLGRDAPFGFAPSRLPVAVTSNAGGRSPFLLVCDHASNRIPPEFAGLGLGHAERLMHIAWDPGALAVSRLLSDMLDAALVYSTISRLVVDPNRHPDSPGLIPAVSERTRIPGNENLGSGERLERISAFHAPYHAAIDTLIESRTAAGRSTILVALHSFTPVYYGESRPWPIGVLHGADTAFTRAVFDALSAEDPTMSVGWNQPYAAGRGLTYTLEQHGDGRVLPSTMIEIRHDGILDTEGVASWARRVAAALERATGIASPLDSQFDGQPINRGESKWSTGR